MSKWLTVIALLLGTNALAKTDIYSADTHCFMTVEKMALAQGRKDARLKHKKLPTRALRSLYMTPDNGFNVITGPIWVKLDNNVAYYVSYSVGDDGNCEDVGPALIYDLSQYGQ